MERLRSSGNTKLANSKFVNFIDLVSKVQQLPAVSLSLFCGRARGISSSKRTPSLTGRETK